MIGIANSQIFKKSIIAVLLQIYSVVLQKNQL